jgi:hypothetical protein
MIYAVVAGNASTKGAEAFARLEQVESTARSRTGGQAWLAAPLRFLEILILRRRCSISSMDSRNKSVRFWNTLTLRHSALSLCGQRNRTRTSQCCSHSKFSMAVTSVFRSHKHEAHPNSAEIEVGAFLLTATSPIARVLIHSVIHTCHVGGTQVTTLNNW